MDRTCRSIPVLSIVVVIVFAVGFALLMYGQAPQSTPVSLPTTPAQSAQSATAVPTIRTYSNLVVVDVVVNDSHGEPVHGLKLSDFSLTENNKLQNIRHFEEHSEVPASDVKVEDQPKLPPGLFTNKTPAPINGPVNVLLLDYLNTPLNSQPYARRQLLDYLDHAPPGTRIAIFGLTTHIFMLQGFTSDMAVLKAAITGKKGAPQSSDILSDPINGGPITDTTLSDSFASSPAAVNGMETQEDVDAINRFQALATSFQQDMIAQYTLNAFDMLARYLIGIPGRKNVIWFSGGFPLDVEPNPNEADPNDSVVRNDDLVRKTDNLLTRAQVAVYPVDARGVMTDPSLNFANSSNNTSGAAAATAYSSWLNETAQEHETMEAMAEDTGGTPFYNTNGLTQAVQKAIRNGSNYYTLTYSPTDTQWDERFRTIKVKVDQSGLKLSYRNGYYAFDPNDRNKLNAGQAATAVAQRPTTMSAAMMHGGPDPAEILFKVRIRPADAPPAESPLATNRTNPNPKVKVEGPYKSYGVDMVPDPKAVNCQQGEDGLRHCALEIWTYVYDRDGQLLVTTGNNIFRKLTPADYTQMMSGRMAFHQEVSVPVKGEHYLRMAIHDMNSDRVGAVEIPVAAVAKLEPLKPLPAVPAAAATTFSATPDAVATPAAQGTSTATDGAPPAAGTAAPAAGTPSVSVPVLGNGGAAPVQNTNPNPTLRRRTDPSATTPPTTPPATPPTSPN